MSKKTPATDDKTPSEPAAKPDQDFEAALKALEDLVEKLEGGELGLAESLKHFEKGVALSRQCHQMIDQARQKVTMLTDPDDPGSEVEFSSGQ